jgi:hypothetical protein
VNYESLVIVLSAGGAALERDALDTLEGMTVTWVRVEREESAACLAARVRHLDPLDRFRDRLRRWGGARGWVVTVAPGRWTH